METIGNTKVDSWDDDDVLVISNLKKMKVIKTDVADESMNKNN